MNYIPENDSTKENFNVVHFFFISFCFLSVDSFAKLSQDFNLGSAWTIASIVVFFFLLAPIVIYVQFLLSAKYPRGILNTIETHSPWTVIFGVATMIFNCWILIKNSISITLSLSYIIFAAFNCNKKCLSNSFMWSSCSDKYSFGDCFSIDRKVGNTFTKSSKYFFQNIIFKDIEPSFPGSFNSWFDLKGLYFFPYLIGWFLVALMTVGGKKYFVSILYILCPLSIGCLITTCVNFSLDKDAWKNLRTPTLETHYYLDEFSFEFRPLFWGIIKTVVHLSTVTRLFNGVYPVLASWISPEAKISRHIIWLPVLFMTGLVNVLPQLTVFIVTKDYYTILLRCHLADDYAIPFTMIAEAFFRSETNKFIKVAFYLGLAAQYMLSQSLLLLCTVENIVSHMSTWSESVESKYHLVSKIMTYFITIVLLLIGAIFLTSSGSYWYLLVDWYGDHLFSLVIFGQAIGFLILYLKTQMKRLFILKLLVAIFFVAANSVFIICYIWNALASNDNMATSNCTANYHDLNHQMLTSPYYKRIGMTLASVPIIMGSLLGLFIVSRNSQILEVPFKSYLLSGKRSEHYEEANAKENRYNYEMAYIPNTFADSFNLNSSSSHIPRFSTLNHQAIGRNEYAERDYLITGSNMSMNRQFYNDQSRMYHQRPSTGNGYVV